MRLLVVVLAAASFGIFALLLDELRMPAHAPPTITTPIAKPTATTSDRSPPRPAASTPTRRAPASPPHSALSSPIEAKPPSPSLAPAALSTWRGPSVFGNLPTTPLDEEPPRPIPAYVIVDGPRIIDHGDGSRVIITSSELEVYY